MVFFNPNPKKIDKRNKIKRIALKSRRTEPIKRSIWSRIISVSLICINVCSLAAEKVTQKEKKSRYSRVHTHSAARVSKQWDRKTIVTQCQSTGSAKVSWHSGTHAGCFLISKLMQEISRTIISSSWFPFIIYCNFRHLSTFMDKFKVYWYPTSLFKDPTHTGLKDSQLSQ